MFWRGVAQSQWQSGKRGTGSRSVLPARFRAIVSFASVLSFPYQPKDKMWSWDGQLWAVSQTKFSTDPNFLVLLFKDGDFTERSLAYYARTLA